MLYRIAFVVVLRMDGAYAAKLILKDLIIFASYCLNIMFVGRRVR